MSKAKTQHLCSMFHENFQVIDLWILLSADVKKKKKNLKKKNKSIYRKNLENRIMMQYVEKVSKEGLGLMIDFEQGEQGQEGKR